MQRLIVAVSSLLLLSGCLVPLSTSTPTPTPAPSPTPANTPTPIVIVVTATPQPPTPTPVPPSPTPVPAPTKPAAAAPTKPAVAAPSPAIAAASPAVSPVAAGGAGAYHVTALVDGLDVPQMISHKAIDGTLWYEGEVVNNSNRTLGNVGVIVELYNDRNERLARGGSNTPSRNVLKPGDKAVWDTFLSDSPASFARTEVQVGLTSNPQFAIDADYPDVQVSNVAYTARDNFNGGVDLDIKGTVTNSGSQDVRDVQFAAAVYDAGGKLQGVATGGILNPLPDDLTLPAGKSMEFLVQLLGRQPPLPRNPAKVEAYVKANKPNQ